MRGTRDRRACQGKYLYTQRIETKFLLGLLADHEVHGGEEVLLSTLNQAVSGKGQAVGSLLGAPGEETDLLTGTHEAVGNTTTPPGHAGNGEEVPGGAHVLEGARQRVVPRNGVGASSQVLVVLHLEASVLHSLDTLRDADHVGDTITLLDTETDATVLGIVVVVLVGHEPLVDGEGTAGLEDTEDLAVDTDELGGVDGGLNGVDSVEAVVGEVHLHEVALDEGHLVGETLLVGVVGGAVDLVVVVVQTSDVSTSELDHLASGTTDTTADIQNLHVLGDTSHVGEVVLVTGNGLVERLTVGETAEVEGGAPSVLVEIGSQVVVAVERSLVWGVAIN